MNFTGIFRTILIAGACLLLALGAFIGKKIHAVEESLPDSVENLKEENKQLKQQNEELDNYINWKNCIDGSDFTDEDCHKCDSLYNPNGEFQY